MSSSGYPLWESLVITVIPLQTYFDKNMCHSTSCPHQAVFLQLQSSVHLPRTFLSCLLKMQASEPNTSSLDLNLWGRVLRICHLYTLSRSSLCTLKSHVYYLVHFRETRRRKPPRLPNIKLSEWMLINELGEDYWWWHPVVPLKSSNLSSRNWPTTFRAGLPSSGHQKKISSHWQDYGYCLLHRSEGREQPQLWGQGREVR